MAKDRARAEAPGCGASPSAADGVFAESHPSRDVWEPDPDCECCFGTGVAETGGDEPHTAFSVSCICMAPAIVPGSEICAAPGCRNLTERGICDDCDRWVLHEAAKLNAPCTMGVGCDEYGVCFAVAHGRPEMCARDSDGSPEGGDGTAPFTTARADEGGIANA